MSISVAMPLRAYLADSPQPKPPIDAATLLRELVAHAGVLADPAPGGDRFVLAVLPPHLVEALAAHAAPRPQPMPLLEWRAIQ